MNNLRKDSLELGESHVFDITWEYENNTFSGKVFYLRVM